jgi:hypothetical protein
MELNACTIPVTEGFFGFAIVYAALIAIVLYPMLHEGLDT